MDKYIENRFGYLREYSLEQLLKERLDLIDDINYMLDVTYSENSSLRKSEFLNTDLKFDKEKLEYIECLLEERNVKNKTRK